MIIVVPDKKTGDEYQKRGETDALFHSQFAEEEPEFFDEEYKKKHVIKGEGPGHPFRGNQYVEGESDSSGVQELHSPREPAWSERARRAKESYVPCTQAKLKHATNNERVVAGSIKGGIHIGGTEPFDVHIEDPPKHVIEVKTLIEGVNDKITIHPPSKEKKDEFDKKYPKQDFQKHLVVFDDRKGKGDVYYQNKIGSFRLTTMRNLGKRSEAVKKLNKIIYEGG